MILLKISVILKSFIFWILGFWLQFLGYARESISLSFSFRKGKYKNLLRIVWKSFDNILHFYNILTQRDYTISWKTSNKKRPKSPTSSSSSLIRRDFSSSASSENDRRRSEISRNTVPSDNLSSHNSSERWKKSEYWTLRRTDNSSRTPSEIRVSRTSWTLCKRYFVTSNIYPVPIYHLSAITYSLLCSP